MRQSLGECGLVCECFTLEGMRLRAARAEKRVAKADKRACIALCRALVRSALPSKEQLAGPVAAVRCERVPTSASGEARSSLLPLTTSLVGLGRSEPGPDDPLLLQTMGPDQERAILWGSRHDAPAATLETQ
jgi:hypothetical protein